STIDGATNNVTQIPVAPLVFGAVINPGTGVLYLISGDSAGTLTVVNGRTGTGGPAFTVQPASQTVVPGSLVAMRVSANSGPNPVYQWSLNGTPLADGAGVSGSATATLYVSGASAASAGTYTCSVTDSIATTVSAGAVLTVAASANPGRFVNLSCRAFVGSAANSVQSDLIAGFAISGQGSKSVVLRGIGPGLGAFGLSEAAPSLTLSLFDGAATPNLITRDSAWQTPPSAPAGAWAGKVSPVDATAADFQQVGAFALASGSADTAVKVALPAGTYTSDISAPAAPYLALAEVYDADLPGAGARLINLSARAFVAGGADEMVAGFVISGSTSQTVLIRASGPALAAFGITGFLAQPQLMLFNSAQTAIASNAGWQGGAEIAQVAASAGAFAWNSPSSADSALLVTLPPGNYTAQVTSAGTDSGTALVEVYSVP
ncbi:MAG TPA: immunoglobulin domain-containing protein, partial [Opitutaceae bacterium]